ncbi:MAG: O-antigen ligase family protein [Rhodobacteraceae bacterium]|nr:MAG: O-antigen ligase family protein [Paracoccaceae bacterium]
MQMPSNFRSSSRHATRSHGRSVQAGYRRTVLCLMAIAIGLALMMNGSVATPYRQISTLLLSVPLVLSLGIAITEVETRRIVRWALILLSTMTGWIVLQTLQMPIDALAHPVWSDLSQAGIEAGQYISAAPAQTRESLPSLILPALVFIAMLMLCQRKADAILAWKILAVIGVALTLLCIILELFFEGTLFFSSRPVGQSSFSGIMVNRNVTASFLGMTGLLLGAWLLLPDEQARYNRSDIGKRIKVPLGLQKSIIAVFLFLTIVTLLVTRSRAGASFGLFALTLSFMACIAMQRGQSQADPPARQLGFKSTLAALAGFGVFAAFGGPVMSRMASRGLDDSRWCAWQGTWQAIRETPLTGAGFGTFTEVFPRFRDAECLGTTGWWTRTHNLYLEFLAGTGLIGAAIGCAALYMLVRILTIGLSRRKSLRPIVIFSAGSLLFLLLHSGFDFPLQIPGVSFYFAAIMGVGCAVALLERRPRPSKGARHSVEKSNST